MRELKFRAWIEADKKYYYNIAIAPASEEFPMVIISGDGLIFRADQVVEQFAGLQDKNGTDIYEGDILRNTKYINMKPVAVSWANDLEYCGFVLRESGFEIGNLFLNKNLVNLKIIGNIHQNKELLDE